MGLCLGGEDDCCCKKWSFSLVNSRESKKASSHFYEGFFLSISQPVRLSLFISESKGHCFTKSYSFLLKLVVDGVHSAHQHI